MRWLWTDDLAVLLEKHGSVGSVPRSWKERPVAVRVSEDQEPLAVALDLLTEIDAESAA